MCPFKVISVNMSKLLIKMFIGNFDYVDKEDSEFTQVVDIAIPDNKFEDLLLHKTFYSRKYGIIGQTVLKADVLQSATAKQIDN